MIQHDAQGQEGQELNWLRGEFVSTVARQLSTPVSLIKIFSDTLLIRPLDEERQCQLLTQINEQSTRLADVLTDLGEILQLEIEHRFALTTGPVDTLELLDQALASLAELTSGHQLQIEGFRPDFPPALGDAFWLMWLIKNLISNAVKNSPTGSTIAIRQKLVQHGLEISVHYDMPMEGERPGLRNITCAGVCGAGLNLTTTELIAELNNGKLWTEASNSGGTVVYCTLPLAESQDS